MSERTIAERVAGAAEDALAREGYVSAVEVFMRLGWLHYSAIDHWRQGRSPNLEARITASPSKVQAALKELQRWAWSRGLRPTEATYQSRTRDRRTLQFTASGDPGTEHTYRTHWVSADLPEQEQRKVTEKASKPPDLVVIAPLKEFVCKSCGGSGGLLIMEGADDDAGPLCMTCAEMDHLFFLPTGNAALTRRAKKASRLSAVVVRFSRTRKRYERQGILVEEAALANAERQCLEDAEARARRNEREGTRRAQQDKAYEKELTEQIIKLYPRCPPERATAIAIHTAVRGSGRVGRTAAARELDPRMIELAVVASVRHLDTEYDDLLMAGIDREDARQQVRPAVQNVIEEWRA